MLFEVTYSKNVLKTGHVYNEDLKEFASDIWSSSLVEASSKESVADALISNLGESKLNYILSIDEVNK